jgi:hypothetical protein
MAAQSYKIYNLAKLKLGKATFNLLSAAWRMSLHQSASNAATLTLGVYNSLTSEVASGNGYALRGQALATVVWTVGASAKSYKFSFANLVWTGTGGTIPNIKLAAVWVSAASTVNRHLLCVASLTSSQFTLALNNTLTIQNNALGCFTMQ